MAAKVIQLPQDGVLRTPVGFAIRTGDTFYRQLGHLHAEGRLPARRVIVDASKVRFQKELVKALGDDGADITLDTKAAELSEIGKFSGRAKGAPWAAVHENRPLRPSDFKAGANINLFGKIAQLAVELGITSVMAPTHFLKQGGDDSWLPTDRESVITLRRVLDREGGSQIGIDYPLIVPHTSITVENHRQQFAQALSGLPIDNLVLRLSGFGADAGPLTIRRTLVAIQQLHLLGYPILLDYVGGLVGLSALAFGIVSGIAHGIGERERFDARAWDKPQRIQKHGTSFGPPIYLPVPGLDKSVRKKDLEVLAGTTGGRRLVACGDRHCCPHGLSSMLDSPRGHIAWQKFRDIDRLYEIPDAWRVEHFLGVVMRDAERSSRDLARLRTNSDRLDKVLRDGRKRIDSMAKTYEFLAEQDRPSPPALIARKIRNTSVGRGSA